MVCVGVSVQVVLRRGLSQCRGPIFLHLVQVFVLHLGQTSREIKILVRLYVRFAPISKQAAFCASLVIPVLQRYWDFDDSSSPCHV
jgi:hypothetical protein